MPAAYLIFHLNLAYSSIAIAARGEVIRRCYHPLLDLAETSAIPLGVELTGWTLRQIEQLDPGWVSRLRGLLVAGRCELVGSGYVQLIGPLVPYAVNQCNQRLGRSDYARLLGVEPALALVNEMAYSSALPGIYRQAGYGGMVMDRDNIRLALGLEHAGYESVPSAALGSDGASLPVLWSDSILFQKLQRFAHGDIPLFDYLDYFHRRTAEARRPLAVYCNDAEIFDFRPGRFREESGLHADGEWTRIGRLLDLLGREHGVRWLSPSAALRESLAVLPGEPRRLTSITQPVPVKKQAKYNLSRWAVTGRNDLWLNSVCHCLYQQLAGGADDAAWRQLCELWASDLRTHITAERWQQTVAEVGRLATTLTEPAAVALPQAVTLGPGECHPLGVFRVATDADLIHIEIHSPQLRLTLNTRRGATIHALAFAAHDFAPVVGTLPHGYFESIDLGADFYSAGVIVELPGQHRRITDLERVVPEFWVEGDALCIRALLRTALGGIEKTYRLDAEGVSMAYRFSDWPALAGVFRVATVTLLPEAFDGKLGIECSNGGAEAEWFALDRDADHARTASPLVSATTGFGATTGQIRIGDVRRGIELSWDPAECAALPMLVHRQAQPAALTRIMFSLGELDETSCPRTDLPPFRLRIAPIQGCLPQGELAS